MLTRNFFHLLHLLLCHYRWVINCKELQGQKWTRNPSNFTHFFSNLTIQNQLSWPLICHFYKLPGILRVPNRSSQFVKIWVHLAACTFLSLIANFKFQQVICSIKFEEHLFGKGDCWFNFEDFLLPPSIYRKYHCMLLQNSNLVHILLYFTFQAYLKAYLAHLLNYLLLKQLNWR